MKLARAAVFVVSWPLAAAAQGPVAEPGLVLDLGGSASLELILVKGGRVEQGSPANESGRGDDEARREVTLTRDYYIGKTPVTLRQFERFVQESGYRTEAEKGSSGGFGWDGKALVQRPEFTWRNPGFAQTGDHPVTIVTFDDALAFAQWLSAKAGRAVSLPTEAQWEHACRAGSSARFYLGDADETAREIGWFKANAGNGTQAVGQKKPNGFGLYDMSGNVYEWCRDWYAPYAPGPVSDPEETRSTLSDRPRRVLRGGSWLKDARHLRCAARYRNTPGSRNADNGFRVVAATARVSAPAAATPAAPLPAGGGAPVQGEGSATAALVTLLAAVAVFVGVIAAFVAFVIRRVRRADSHGIGLRRGNDGVWFRVPRQLRGSTVRYRYRTAAGVREDSFVADAAADEQFVYTGDAPADVRILNVVPSAAALSRRSTRGRDDHEEDDDDRDDASFRGYPSAY
jgi:formylglycine-generating enzyme required for sulfatase activity